MTPGEPSYLRRLEHARELWHGALEAYPDADAFTNAVNNLIPTLRTVTFLLQKELAHRDGFDEWYAYWRQAMIDDEVMRWLVDARNFIEKQGDLEVRSTARVEIIAGWPEAPSEEMDLPPLLPPHVIAYHIAQTAPDFVRKEGLVRVQRRWVTATLPDHEILEACAHGWAVLSDVVNDANAFVNGGELRRPGRRRPPADLAAGLEARTAVYHIEAGEFVRVETIRVERDKEVVEAAGQRYGTIDGVPRPDATFQARVRWHHEVSRRLFGVDGHLLGFTLMFKEGRIVDLLGMEMADQQAKYLIFERLAAQVVAANADEIVHSFEAWIAPHVGPDDPRSNLRAGQREEREEALVSFGLASNGREVQFTTFVTRDGDSILLADAAEAEPYLGQMYNPVRAVWGLTSRANEDERRG